LRHKQKEIERKDIKQNSTLEEKDYQIKQLNDTIKRLNDDRKSEDLTDCLANINQRLFNSKIYTEVLGTLNDQKKEISAEQWKDLELMFSKEHPKYYAMINASDKLNITDRRICMLIRLGFKPKNISSIMGIDKSNVSNTRSRLYKKLFGEEGTGKDLDSRLLSI